MSVNKNRFLTDTIRERPLPSLPLEDTFSSNFNLSRKDNFKSDTKQVENLFNTKNDSNFLVNSKSENHPEQKEEIITHLNNITFLLAKVVERIESMDEKIDKLDKKFNTKSLEPKIDLGEQQNNRKLEIEMEEIKKQNLGLKMDKDILLKLIKKMVDQNADNIPIINEEFYSTNSLS